MKAARRPAKPTVAAEPPRSAGAAVQAPVTPEVAAVPVRRPSVAGCRRYVQREIARAMPEICAMLLRETTEKKNLAALRMLLQLAAGVVPADPPAKAADNRFARRMVDEFRLQTATGLAAPLN